MLTFVIYISYNFTDHNTYYNIVILLYLVSLQ